MPGPRGLSRKSSHRVAMLRNMVTSLFEQERIQTSWHKAKEAQRVAEKLVTLAKKNTEASRRRAHQIFYRPHDLVPKLFSTIRLRYATRPRGYTRVLRIEPHKDDQAPSAILELVDSPKDTRFISTALTLARMRRTGAPMNEITSMNVAKVTQFREGGVKELEDLVQYFEQMGTAKDGQMVDPVERMLRGQEPEQVKAGVSRQLATGRRELRDRVPFQYKQDEEKKRTKLVNMGGSSYYSGGKKVEYDGYKR